jgi:glycosyltransferase involved in cell wall biosynthesis
MVDGIRVIELDLAYSNKHGFARRAWTFLRFAVRSILLALREPCDVVFATSTPLTAALPGLAARWLRSKPFVFEVRDLWPELPRAMGVIRNPLVLGAMSAIEFAAYRSASVLVGLSPGIVEGIAKRGTPADRIHMVPNGCDLEIFDSDAAAWRPEGVAAEDLMCVFAGTHGIANGLDAVLDAAAVLKARGRGDIKIVLVGDGKLKPALEQRAAREGLDNVVFLAPVNKTRLAGLLAGADVGLQILDDVPAFYYGTSPNKFFDYLAAGRPVLTNYPGWVADLVSQHQCGWSVPPRDAQAFAGALVDAASSRSRLPALGANARSLARGPFSRRVLARQWSSAVLGAVPGTSRAATESTETR